MISKTERQETLTTMWELTASAVLRALSTDTPSAAALEVSRKFLADNDCTVATLRSWRETPLGFDPTSLPKFEEDNAESGQTENGSPDNAAMTSVAPFAPADD